MYVYVYDENIIKNESVLHKVEKRLTDLGLNGQSIKPAISKNIKVAIDDKIKAGAKTIVAVGEDKIISEVINIVANNKSDNKHSITVGMIPINKKGSFIGSLLGINGIDEACKVLLARRLENINLAKINENFFLFKAEVETSNTSIIEINKRYTIQSSLPAQITIYNQPEKKDLAIIIKNKTGETKVRAFSSLLINKDAPIITDGSFETKAPAMLLSGEDSLKIIIGKNRKILN